MLFIRLFVCLFMFILYRISKLNDDASSNYSA